MRLNVNFVIKQDRHLILIFTKSLLIISKRFSNFNWKYEGSLYLWIRSMTIWPCFMVFSSIFAMHKYNWIISEFFYANVLLIGQIDHQSKVIWKVFEHNSWNLADGSFHPLTLQRPNSLPTLRLWMTSYHTRHIRLALY